jgi:hypothetical protein
MSMPGGELGEVAGGERLVQLERRALGALAGVVDQHRDGLGGLRDALAGHQPATVGRRAGAAGLGRDGLRDLEKVAGHGDLLRSVGSDPDESDVDAAGGRPVEDLGGARGDALVDHRDRVAEQRVGGRGRGERVVADPS